jgi:hydroxyethylthiazole kinase-like uncharacterized protein yjeF
VKQRPLDREGLEEYPLPPVINGDKETKGRVLVVAGSREVPGAALLAATAAMRAGAGKLAIATVESIAVQLGLAMPEAMVIGLPEDEAGGFAVSAASPLAEQSSKVDAVVAGPGVKVNGACGLLCQALYESRAALALDVAFLKTLSASHRNREVSPVLLPDTDELAALLDCDEDSIRRDPIGCGRHAAEVYRSVVLVKGPISYVVAPNGHSWTYNGGTPGLGVSGSGDSLAGIVGGLLARGAEPLTALLWSVWLHGEAGKALARKIGPIGFLARQIADEIPALMAH